MSLPIYRSMARCALLPYPLPLCSFKGEVFYEILIIIDFFYLPHPHLPRLSCRLRHRADRHGHRRLQRRHDGPGFWDNTTLRHGLVTPPGDPECHPPRATHTHQPQAGCPPCPRAFRAHTRHVEPRANGHRLVCDLAHTEPPPRRDCSGSPKARRPVRVPPTRAVPRPPGPRRDVQALVTPRA